MEDCGIIVFCTFSSIEEAKNIATDLVKRKLAACCTILPKVTSIYSWESKLEENEETMMMIKTSQKNYEQLEKQIKMLHSYSVPEIISVKIEKGSKAYMDWLFENTRLQD